jgi:hypothetical protein
MFTNSMIYQPKLFEFLENENLPDANSAKIGKSLVSKINKLRRALNSNEREFDYILKRAVDETKSVSALDREKQENLILTCLETCSHTWGELEDDSHLSKEKVREILLELQSRDLIFARKRHTFGGSAKQTLIYSKRKNCSCL